MCIKCTGHFALLPQSINYLYLQTSNTCMRHSLVGNKLADHLDVVGAWPVGAAPTTF